MAQAERLRQRIAPLAQADAEAYERRSRAPALPEPLEPEVRDMTLGVALGRAAEIPLAIAEAGADVAELAALVAERGNARRAAATPSPAALLAEAGTRAAATSSRSTWRRRPKTSGSSRPARLPTSPRAPPRQASSAAARRRIEAWPSRHESAPLPAWSLPAGTAESLALPTEWPGRVTREWAWGDSTGKGVSVCILDSGDRRATTRSSASSTGAVAVEVGEGDEVEVIEDDEGDLCGHGTACAGIVRSIAPDCRLFSVRVLGAGFTGSGTALLGGLRWAVEQGFDVINMSLSTTKSQFAGHAARARRHRPTSAGPCSSRPRTTCRSRATRGGSRR